MAYHDVTWHSVSAPLISGLVLIFVFRRAMMMGAWLVCLVVYRHSGGRTIRVPCRRQGWKYLVFFFRYLCENFVALFDWSSVHRRCVRKFCACTYSIMSKRLIANRIKDEARVAQMNQYIKNQQIGTAIAREAERADRQRVVFQQKGSAMKAKEETEAAREAVTTIRTQKLKELYQKEFAE